MYNASKTPVPTRLYPLHTLTLSFALQITVRWLLSAWGKNTDLKPFCVIWMLQICQSNSECSLTVREDSLNVVIEILKNHLVNHINHSTCGACVQRVFFLWNQLYILFIYVSVQLDFLKPHPHCQICILVDNTTYDFFNLILQPKIVAF